VCVCGGGDGWGRGVSVTAWNSNNSAGRCWASPGRWSGEAGAFRQQQIAAAATQGETQVGSFCGFEKLGAGQVEVQAG
jgi:hypothetical protein